MALTPGIRFGPYEIVSTLGAGGMGEVYRARDTRLERTVAIKTLPAEFSSDPVRKQRFEREAAVSVATLAGAAAGLARPKSSAFAPVGVNMMLPGLKSR